MVGRSFPHFLKQVGLGTGRPDRNRRKPLTATRQTGKAGGEAAFTRKKCVCPLITPYHPLSPLSPYQAVPLSGPLGAEAVQKAIASGRISTLPDNVSIGRIVEGGTGATIAGALLFYLTRNPVRSAFGRHGSR